MVEFFFIHTDVFDGFHDGDNGGDPGPAEHHIKETLAGFVVIELVGSEPSHGQGQSH